MEARSAATAVGRSWGSVAALERDSSSRGEQMTDENRDMGKDQMPDEGMGQGRDDMSRGMGRDSGQGTGQGSGPGSGQSGPSGEGSLKGAIADTRGSEGQRDMTGPEGNRSWQSVESEDDTAEAGQSREEQQTPR
jgi:hypothetical protein